MVQWNFSFSGKTFSFSLSQFFCLAQFISLSLHHLPRSSLPLSPSFSCSFFVLLFYFSSFPFFHLSTSCTFSPYLPPSFDGLHSLLSSSCLTQPLFSQDASLQGLLHQNGTETERGRELRIELGICNFAVLTFWDGAGGKLLPDVFIGEICILTSHLSG